MTQYAKIETKSSPLASEFGVDWATKLFGAEALADLPRFSKGRSKGRLKGYVFWINVIEGGWSHKHGSVVFPGKVTRAWVSPAVCGGGYPTELDALRKATAVQRERFENERVA
jgi:hypothetical protein